VKPLFKDVVLDKGSVNKNKKSIIYLNFIIIIIITNLILNLTIYLGYMFRIIDLFV